MVQGQTESRINEYSTNAAGQVSLVVLASVVFGHRHVYDIAPLIGRHDSPDLARGLRVQGKVDEPHHIMIHGDDVAAFERRVRSFMEIRDGQVVDVQSGITRPLSPEEAYDRRSYLNAAGVSDEELSRVLRPSPDANPALYQALSSVIGLEAIAA